MAAVFIFVKKNAIWKWMTKHKIISIILMILLFINIYWGIRIVAEDKPLDIDFPLLQPIVYQPDFDIDAGNKLDKMYYSIYKSEDPDYVYRISLTLYFLDEDDPVGNDGVNDLFRLIVFRRVADIEEIDLYITENNFIGKVDFKSIFSGSNTWRQGVHIEASVIYPNSRSLILYINTWNHAMSLEPTNFDFNYIKNNPSFSRGIGPQAFRCQNDLLCIWKW